MAGPRKRDRLRIGGNPRRAGFRTLVVATDFTPGAAWASGRAALLPFASGAEIRLLHVLPDGIPADLRARVDQDARRSLDEVVLPAFRAAKAAGAAPSPGVRIGMPYVEIIREARARAADLIVLGRHGRRGIRDLFLGSTAERVIRMGGAPVLVVNRRPARPYRRMLIALDLGDTSRATVELALRVAGGGEVEMILLHACGTPFQGFVASGLTPAELDAYRRERRVASLSILRGFQESLGDRGASWRTTVRSGDPRVEILCEAERRRADLIVLGTHGRTGVSHALLGSVAEWIVRRAERDVLVARAAPVSFDLP